jgi:HK97 family phage prohead protease
MSRNKALIQRYKQERAARESRARQAAFGAAYGRERNVGPRTELSFERRSALAEKLKGTVERRMFPSGGELRVSEYAGDGTRGPMLRTLASATGKRYDMGWGDEEVAPGAFKRTLSQQPDVSLLLSHGNVGSGYPLCRTTAGNLWLEKTSDGLVATAEMDPDDQDCALLMSKMSRGLVGGPGSASFAFRVTDDDWSDDRRYRLIKCVELNRGDISICTTGASPPHFVVA